MIIVIASDASEAEVRVLISTNTSSSSVQRDKVLEILGCGRMDNINVKLMSSGNIRLSAIRGGRNEGYQRMSFEIDLAGRTIKVVQTAFDNDNNLVRQQPGAARNNLFDVKKWKNTI